MLIFFGTKFAFLRDIALLRGSIGRTATSNRINIRVEIV